MIHDKIKLLRKMNHLTQEQLAKIMGISKSTIGMYEQDRRQPDAATIIILSRIFNVSTDYLLGLSEESPYQNETAKRIAVNKKEEQFLISFRKLDSDYKDIIWGELKKCLKMQEQEHARKKKEQPQKKQA